MSAGRAETLIALQSVESPAGRSNRENERSEAEIGSAQSSQAISARGSGVYEQYRPVRIVEERCRPRAGFARARFSIAARMALVTLSLARSA
jgi:hypothetical protein